MIIGIGIDIIEIARFARWHLRSKKQLERIFTSREIAYCLEHTIKSAERFAARFAAKEAFYKALSPYLAQKSSFFSMCSRVEITTNPLALSIIWNEIALTIDPWEVQVHVSITHSAKSASAVVILERIANLNQPDNMPFFVDKPPESGIL